MNFPGFNRWIEEELSYQQEIQEKKEFRINRKILLNGCDSITGMIKRESRL